MKKGKAGFHDTRHTRQKPVNRREGPEPKVGVRHQPPKCPECASQKVWRDGWRKTNHGDVQRFLCRDCGLRFSVTQGQVKLNIPRQILKPLHPGTNVSHPGVRGLDFPLKEKLNSTSLGIGENVGSHDTSLTITRIAKPLKAFRCYNSNRRVCAEEGEAKNLVQVESQQSEGAGATKTDAETIKGIIAQFAYWLEKEGYYEDSGYLRLICTLAKRGANLLDPEDVKSKIAKQPWKDGTKNLAVYAYDAMTKMLRIEWTPPKYVQEQRLPWIPEEKELDALIGASRSRRMTAYLQTLKETFADPGEALKLRWIDVNASNNTITINYTVKGHSPRQLQVSTKLIAMLNALPKTSERVFPTTYSSLDMCFIRLKRRAAQNLQNPRLLNIAFTTFRHWGATMTYHYTRNILLVQKLLGHKNIKNTLKYTQLIQFKDSEFDVATATTVDEAKELLKVGFDYITERNGVMLFRRPKRFGSLGVTAEN